MTRDLSLALALGSIGSGEVQEAMRRSFAALSSLLLAQGRCDDFEYRGMVPALSFASLKML